MLGARLCNVVGDRPLVVLLVDIQDWGIAICCCTKFVQKVFSAFFFISFYLLRFITLQTEYNSIL
tara:strand:+ start:178 stop:372 length:195 start_codon:yes stop_codon:yes gene_type:complete